ncbi:MAG: beta-ketoacyl synthase N-terminal-like domain-containing protein [Mycobacterium sp.]
MGSELPVNAVAVVGMAGRFPGADRLSVFWRNLCGGVESIVDLSEDDLLAAGVGERVLADHAYVRRAALLEGIDEFDADFFGFTPYVARMTDPQHRLFLQAAFHALEDAGYDPVGGVGGSVGVYATSTTSGYLLHNLMSNSDPWAVIGQGVTFEMVNLSLQNDKDYLATKVAHQFDLRGPALSVQTACSSALVAVHLACQGILNGECDVALAGGASLRIPHRVGYWHEAGSMVSASGRCRPFDVRADGTVFGSGVGVVVLKSLADAVDDGDRVHAVIRGSALNNDGSTKMTYAAPNAVGQAEVIAEAHAVAGVDAATVGYVETHGTGTPLGDPVEIEGLRQAFGVSEAVRSGPCVVGSVKSNIGHLESAAGIAGLIKTILCLKHRAIPATLHYTSPNPELHLDRGPFVVAGEYGAWETDGVRRAGVSSFGVGGTNAHVVVEEWVAPVVSAAPAGPQVLVLSARSGEALGRSRAELAAELSGPEQVGLADVAYTLAGRRAERVRMAAVVSDRADAAAVLGAGEHDKVFVGESVPGGGGQRVVFLFPGQGAQHVGMGRGLYECEPVFAEHFDACAAGFARELGIDLAAVVFGGTARDLERTDRTQPALFAVQYGLAKLVQAYGVGPAAMAGHSIGEYAAAAIAGVFDLETAIKVVSMRARLMHAAPRGVMVAVAAGAEAIVEDLGAGVDLASVNDPGGCVVAGAEDDVAVFSQRLAERGIKARRVRTSHGFHCRLMDSVIPEFTGFLSRQSLHEPQVPLLSNLTGTWLGSGEASDPATWARAVRATVRFADELDVVLADPDAVVVEVGPGGVLTGSAMRHPRWSQGHRAVRLMRHQVQNRADRDVFLLALGQLWSAGVEVDWTPLRAGYSPRRVWLPGYPFERQRHWVDYKPATPVASVGAPAAAVGVSAVAAAAVGGNGGSPMEAALARIWAQCLGVESVGRGANFFDLGGDSLVAISVAMTASHEGIDVTPQDLYDNPTVAALAKTLTARYAAGGLARQSAGDVAHPPVPPNVVYFLEHGLREAGCWRVPLILRLSAEVSADDIAAVLTAVINHHEVLRLRITRRAGTWEQHLEEPGEFTGLATHPLPEDVGAESGRQHQAVLAILNAQIRQQDLSCPPLAASYISGRAGAPCYLAIGVHAIAADELSREVLLTDLFTAFGQRLAGEPIVLAPVATGWIEWSQRCAALATHPGVVESRDYWLTTASTATLRLGRPVDEPPGVDDLARVSATLSVAQTTELDNARRRLATPIHDILLAALSRTLAATLGQGVIGVDLAGAARSVLKPDLDLHRTLGQLTSLYPITLTCTPADTGSVRQLLTDIHHTLNAVPHHGIGYGLLRYLYAPTARTLDATQAAEVFFSYAGTIPDLPALPAEDAAVQLDPDTTTSIRETIPGLGHTLELRIYRSTGMLHLHWWHDTRSIDSTTVQTLADHYTTTLITLTQDALTEEQTDTTNNDLTLVDLSPNNRDGG